MRQKWNVLPKENPINAMSLSWQSLRWSNSQTCSGTGENSEIKLKQALAGQGFRGSEHHPPGVEVLIKTAKQSHPNLKRKLKRRNDIEPIIGHAKQGHLLGRNFLQGQVGDSINALLADCGFNLRKLFRFFCLKLILALHFSSLLVVYQGRLIRKLRNQSSW
jgi:hypothetical protein